MRRIIENHGYIEIEMDEIPALDPPRVQDNDSPPLLIDDEILLNSFEAAPVTRTNHFQEDAQVLAHQLKAGFSPTETAVSGLELLPSVLKELGHQVPGVGALFATGFLAEDIASFKHLQQHIKHTKKFLPKKLEPISFNDFASQNAERGHNALIQNTLAYVISQFERRSDKLMDSMGGKTLQATGSILIFTGLFTHGLTAIPGLALGAAGTVIKARVGIRSVLNNLKKRKGKELSVNRENHARYLYGLTLLHLHRLGAHNGNYSQSKEAKKSVEFVQNIPGDPHYAAQMAAEFVCSLKGLEFFKKHALTQTEMEHFLEYGLWKIMLEIKS
ncbi:MAG: hypothetical protein WCK49_00285 [Myxococcaceae bacterium]